MLVGGYQLTMSSNNSDFNIYLMGYSTLMFVVWNNLTTLSQNFRSLVLARNVFKESLKIKCSYVRDLIQKNHSPKIELLEGEYSVPNRVTSLVDAARVEKSEYFRYLIFYGSASLSTPVEEDNYVARNEEQSEGMIYSYKRYYSALEAACNEKMQIRRYIRLLSPSEISTRNRSYQTLYLRWLNNQLHQLRRNHNYLLFDCTRAPAWGAGIARIITSTGVAELFDNGKAMILITDDFISEQQKHYGRHHFLQAETEATQPMLYSSALNNDESIDDFVKYIKSIEDAGKSMAVELR